MNRDRLSAGRPGTETALAIDPGTFNARHRLPDSIATLNTINIDGDGRCRVNQQALSQTILVGSALLFRVEYSRLFTLECRLIIVK